MQFDEIDEVEYVPFKGEDKDVSWEARSGPLGNSRPMERARTADGALTVQPPEKKYSVETSLQFSHSLNKESSSRYQAIVLNAWTGNFDSPHFEVGLAQIKNPDHRNGVVHALRVSPFHVKFVSLDEAFFEYMHSHIYSARTQSLVLEHQQKKQSQKTKNWGEGQSLLTIEEALAAQATRRISGTNPRNGSTSRTSKNTNAISGETRRNLPLRSSSA